MKIPEGLDPKIKEILARHLPPENPIIEGETGHLVDVPPLDAVHQPAKGIPVQHDQEKPAKRKWVSFLEQSLPPGDRE